MFIFKFSFVLFLFIFQEYDCARRIQEGVEVTTDKAYMVYLLKASVSPKYYDGWLCGGALVSEWHIVTSAACVTDVTHLYAIAGYEKYVSDSEIYTDPCTKERKKKIVLICTPIGYEFKYQDFKKWANIDIAVVKVESKYDLTDTTYEHVCSYTPLPININYESKYQEPGIDAMVLGWGHREKYREDMDLEDYNEENLNYAPTMIIDKTSCKSGYDIYEGMGTIIDNYMICTDNKGNLDEKGVMINQAQPTAKGCLPHDERRVGGDKTPDCINENENENGADDDEMFEFSRKLRRPANTTNNDVKQNYTNINERNNSVRDSSVLKNLNKTASKAKARKHLTRRNGICQNDHGGPLVTWVGAHEVLIGVATAFKISESLDCTGPYLFTSTQCNGAFLDCVFREATSRRGDNEDVCANFTQQGFKMMERNISWKDHPDGPADNEKNMTTHDSPANTDTNSTMHLKNSKEGNNVKLENNNFTILTNTNKTDILEHTRITKTKNVGNSTSLNLTNTSSINVKKTASVILTSVTVTNLINKTVTNSTDTKHSDSISTKPQLNSTMNNIENTITPIIIENANTSIRNISTAKVYLETTSPASLIKNASLARTTKNLTKFTNQTNTEITN